MGSLGLFLRKYKKNVWIFSLWGLANVILSIWKYNTIAAKCNGVIHGPFSLIGDVPENRACQASFASCCKNYPYPDGPTLDPYFKPCDPVCDDACNLLGRVLGHLLNFNLALTLLPILRNSIWAKFFMKLPFERSVVFHRWIGLFIFILMVLHLVSWWITQPFPSPGWLCWTFTFAFRSDQFNGQLAFLFHAIAALFALEFFRRRYFELFFYTHIMYLGVFAFGIYHTAGVQGYWGMEPIMQFQDDYFIYYLAIPFIMFVVDRIYRFYLSNFVPTRAIIIDSDPNGEITKVVVQRPGFSFASGQYCFVNFPEISKLQWHPFSISSSPESPSVFSFHIKNMGPSTFTGSLYDLARKRIPLRIKVDGPYGAKGLLPEDYRVNVLFCGGIGATPIISILSEMVDRHQYFQKTERVYFHWVVRETMNLMWFADLWEKIFTTNESSNIIKIGHIEFAFTFHLTQSTLARDPINVNKSMEQTPLISTDPHSDGVLDVIPRACFSNGRPHLAHIIKSIREVHIKETGRIALFNCGPQEMTQSLLTQAHLNSDDRLHYDVHEETFFL